MSIAITSEYGLRMVYPGPVPEPCCAFMGWPEKTPIGWEITVFVYHHAYERIDWTEDEEPHDGYYVSSTTQFKIAALDRDDARLLAHLAAKSYLKRDLTEYEAAELRRQWDWMK